MVQGLLANVSLLYDEDFPGFHVKSSPLSFAEFDPQAPHIPRFSQYQVTVLEPVIESPFLWPEAWVLQDPIGILPQKQSAFWVGFTRHLSRQPLQEQTYSYDACSRPFSCLSTLTSKPVTGLGFQPSSWYIIIELLRIIASPVSCLTDSQWVGLWCLKAARTPRLGWEPHTFPNLEFSRAAFWEIFSWKSLWLLAILVFGLFVCFLSCLGFRFLNRISSYNPG